MAHLPARRLPTIENWRHIWNGIEASGGGGGGGGGGGEGRGAQPLALLGGGGGDGGGGQEESSRPLPLRRRLTWQQRRLRIAEESRRGCCRPQPRPRRQPQPQQTAPPRKLRPVPSEYGEERNVDRRVPATTRTEPTLGIQEEEEEGQQRQGGQQEGGEGGPCGRPAAAAAVAAAASAEAAAADDGSSNSNRLRQRIDWQRLLQLRLQLQLHPSPPQQRYPAAALAAWAAAAEEVPGTDDLCPHPLLHQLHLQLHPHPPPPRLRRRNSQTTETAATTTSSSSPSSCDLSSYPTATFPLDAQRSRGTAAYGLRRRRELKGPFHHRGEWPAPPTTARAPARPGSGPRPHRALSSDSRHGKGRRTWYVGYLLFIVSSSLVPFSPCCCCWLQFHAW